VNDAGHTVEFDPADNGDEGSCRLPRPGRSPSRRDREAATWTSGILICGTGIGMSIAANKIDGVRAAAVHDELTAQPLASSHNDANVVCMSGDLLGQSLMARIVEAWLGADFAGGRHERRLGKIAAIERGDDPRG
jgi:RpiB/LacA/LacB family sugar-phosphate isomerase